MRGGSRLAPRWLHVERAECMPSVTLPRPATCRRGPSAPEREAATARQAAPTPEAERTKRALRVLRIFATLAPSLVGFLHDRHRFPISGNHESREAVAKISQQRLLTEVVRHAWAPDVGQ